jgi:hypothetical protein
VVEEDPCLAVVEEAVVGYCWDRYKDRALLDREEALCLLQLVSRHETEMFVVAAHQKACRVSVE